MAVRRTPTTQLRHAGDRRGTVAAVRSFGPTFQVAISFHIETFSEQRLCGIWFEWHNLRNMTGGSELAPSIAEVTR